ncbi:MAG: CHASE2 domain-containing protein [Kovacikia sp.]
MHFTLDIQHIEQTCSFKLSRGPQLRLTAKLPYSDMLTTRYQTWQEAYLKFYETGLRARVEQGGSGILPNVDWRARLVQAEAALLSEFHFWLSSAELLPIRSAIAKAAVSEKAQPDDVVDLLLACDSPLLERLPWETWELGTEFGATKTIRLARSPMNLRAETVPRQRRGRLRILAILGDETGLDFKVDREAVQALAPIADIIFVGWQWGQEQPDLKATICRAIADEQGWDILFFAGHSNETALTGGELVIAPHESLFVQEIARHLTIAKDRGLQFAIFNSCNGLSLAHALIDLGLSQVAIMREPIHNRVAQEFLIGFVQGLANYRDVHTALLAACRSLKLDKNLTYPSAYLIPSLFRHADAALFKPEPMGWRHILKQLLPTRRPEAIGLTVLTVLSLLPPVQDLLMETRVWSQASYRQMTRQLPKTSQPPVLLLAIDNASLQADGVEARKISYLDRTYIARLLNKALTFQPTVIGIDYVLSNPIREDDPALQQAVQRGVAQKIWMVFGTQEKDGQEVSQVATTIASPGQILTGYVTATPGYVELLPKGRFCQVACPFAYLLALAQSLHSPASANLPQPDTQSDFRLQVTQFLAAQPSVNPTVKFIEQAHLSAITSISQVLAQEWFHPILDFSIPPDQVYRRVSAQQFLDASFQTSLPSAGLPPIVLIAPGGYNEAGVNQAGEDNFAVPRAIAYWRHQQSEMAKQPWFTGAEFHAYAIHHLLNRRLVLPVPDLWMLGLALLVAKGIILILKLQRRTPIQRVWVMLAIALYGLVSLQVYLAGVVVPWLLPSVLFWVSVQPVMRKKANAA